ncbi:MAG: sensor histidine kinase [Lachnospiraceae bacterium]|nr:sensor histidine kinase [Candidatus Colinaster equi]
MNTNYMRNLVLNVMLLLNFAIVSVLSLTSAIAIVKISKSMNAREFLEGMNQLPPVPWTVPVIAIGGFVLLTIFLNIKNSILPEHFMVILEIALGVTIIYTLDMNYSGIIFLLAAYLMDYFRGEKRKIGLFIIIGISILVFDFNICEHILPIISFDVYVQYFNSMISSSLLAFINLGTTCNMLLFVVYTILLLSEKIDENKKINELNEKLNSANENLMHANQELEKFAIESQRIAKTKERNRLAREIHDTLGHTLTGIIAGLDAAIAILPISIEQTQNQLEMVRDVARHGMTDVRRSVNELRPDVLERGDLLSAINQIISDVTSTTNVEIEFINHIEQLIFNEDEEDVIYRIIQESITNSIRHGKATKIMVEIGKEYSIMTITIKDNGCGSGNVKYGFGLTHMQERLEMLHGELEIESEGGFTVIATIPIRWGEDND